jgi:UDP-3-O-[3-hydroxymyristoyl] glucosamine N-acyltransferase
MTVSAKDIATFLHASIDGNPDTMVTHPSKIEEAGPGSISFISNPKYEGYAYTTGASVLVVSNEFQPHQPVQATLLRVPNVYQSLGTLLSHFESNGHPKGISDLAFIDSTAKIGLQVAVSPFVTIEKNVIIGDHSILYSNVFLGHDVQIGRNCIIHSGVRIYASCDIRDNVVIQANTVIGSEGFGFAPDEDGKYNKIPQLGNVIIHEDVEIGAGCTIDRATMGSTIIHKGCKLDNLIQVAHNVEIGEHTVIAAQTGIAGSTKIGAKCQIGGQVGIVGHTRIPDGTMIQAQSGVIKVEEETGQKIFGSPAIPYNNYLKSYALFKKLPELELRLRDLEKRLKKLDS